MQISEAVASTTNLRNNMFHKINGSAGYGKTHELIKQIKKLYNPAIKEQDFVLVTPTNKAAMVLNSRLTAVGLPPCAKTLHSTLYMWEQTNKMNPQLLSSR